MEAITLKASRSIRNDELQGQSTAPKPHIDATNRIKRTDLRSQVTALLRARIVSGELAVDQVYSAAALAKTMGVSITPVREAILDIEHSGLIEVIRNRGFRVLSILDEDLDEIRDLRKMLEAPAMAMVAHRASDNELLALRPLLEEMQTASENDLAEFLRMDQAFHVHLMELTRNTRLVKLVENLRDQTRLYGIAALLREGALKETMQEHRAILDALIKRDSGLSVTLMHQHLDHTRGIWAGRKEE
jgi:DNA-binding GntR family transcriptional regulator